MVDFPSKEKYGLADFIRLVDVLRGEGGCPWDREQTHESLRRGMLEEAYETVGAIDEGDPIHLREELGDVLLQVIFHASLARDEGSFDLEEIADAECKKLIYRHPHVFGTASADSSDEVLRNWDILKEREKDQRSLSEVMAGVTSALPALWRAEKLHKKRAKAGKTLPDVRSAFARLHGQLDAWESSIGSERAGEALGEFLFAAADAARLAALDPETELHAACERAIEAERACEAKNEG